MRRLLELFCGTKSVSKAVGHEFDEVISLDLDAAHEPTIRADILIWDYTVYPPGHFQTVWASPPCTEFSCLNRSWPNKVPNIEMVNPTRMTEGARRYRAVATRKTSSMLRQSAGRIHTEGCWNFGPELSRRV